jgi:hypothetical protein
MDDKKAKQDSMNHWLGELEALRRVYWASKSASKKESKEQ